MKEDLDLDLTNPDTQLVIVTKPEDFFQEAELEVATVHLDLLENAVERSLEYTVARVMTRNRPNPNTCHPKMLIDQQIIDEKAAALFERFLDARERLAGIKTKKAKVQKLA